MPFFSSDLSDPLTRDERLREVLAQLSRLHAVSRTHPPAIIVHANFAGSESSNQDRYFPLTASRLTEMTEMIERSLRGEPALSIADLSVDTNDYCLAYLFQYLSAVELDFAPYYKGDRSVIPYDEPIALTPSPVSSAPESPVELVVTDNEEELVPWQPVLSAPVSDLHEDAATPPMPEPKRVHIDENAAIDIVSTDDAGVVAIPDEEMGHLSRVTSPESPQPREMHLEDWQEVDFSRDLGDRSPSQRFSDSGLFGGQSIPSSMSMDLLQAPSSRPVDMPARVLGPVSFVSAESANDSAIAEPTAARPVWNQPFASIGVLPPAAESGFIHPSLPFPPPEVVANVLAPPPAGFGGGVPGYPVSSGSFGVIAPRPNITVEVMQSGEQGPGIVGGRLRPYRKRARPEFTTSNGDLPAGTPKNVRTAVKPQRRSKNAPGYVGNRETRGAKLFPYTFVNEEVYTAMTPEFARWQITKDVVECQSEEDFHLHPLLKNNCFWHAMHEVIKGWPAADANAIERHLNLANFNVTVSYTAIRNMCSAFYKSSGKTLLISVRDHSNENSDAKSRYISMDGVKSSKPKKDFNLHARLCRVMDHYMVQETVTDKAKMKLFGVDNQSSITNGGLLLAALKHNLVKPVTWNDPGVIMGPARSWTKLKIDPLKFMDEAFDRQECLPFRQRPHASSSSQPEAADSERDSGSVSEDTVREDGEDVAVLEGAATAATPGAIDELPWFCDFETWIDPADPRQRHQVYCCAAYSWDEQHHAVFYGEDCFIDIVAFIHSKIGQCAAALARHERPKFAPTLYFHNLRYDACFAFEQTFAVYNAVEKGAAVLQLSGLTSRDRLPFRMRDSAGVLRCKLSDTIVRYWPKGEQAGALKEFGKEIFPYKALTNPKQCHYDISECVKVLKDQGVSAADIDEFCNRAIVDFGYPEDDEFRHLMNLHDYCGYYCERDCLLLCRAWKQCRQLYLGKVTEMEAPFSYDINEMLTVPSIAYRYFADRVFERVDAATGKEVYGFHSSLRAFEQLSVRGGRCMTCDNQSWKLTGTDNIVDFDAVSLYPSAVARLYTFWGAPKRLPAKYRGESARHLLGHTALEDEDTYKDPVMLQFDGFTVACKVTAIGKPLHFPLLCYKDKEGCHWTNQARPNDVLVLNEIDMRNLVEFQDAEITLIDGYVWDQGKDFTCRTEMQRLFDLRLAAKKLGNPIQETIKLIINSAYGKSVLKFINKEKTYVPADKRDAFLAKHATSVLEYYPISEKLWCVELVSEYFDSFNKGEPDLYPNWWGARILSMSKRIMSEVMTIAEDLGTTIYYTDTDSMILHAGKDNCKLLELAAAFRAKTGRVLIGSAMGQFHSDFQHPKLDPKSIHGEALIAVAKKIYCVKLVDKEGNVGLHCRMKGIPDHTVQHYAGGDAWQLYEDLYASNVVDPEHGPIPLQLVDPKKPLFAFSKDKQVMSKVDMVRRVVNKSRVRYCYDDELTTTIDTVAKSVTHQGQQRKETHYYDETLVPHTE